MAKQIDIKKSLIERYEVPQHLGGTRLSDLPSETFITKPTRKSFKKAIKANSVLVNNAFANTAYKVQVNDIIEIFEAIQNQAIDLGLNISVLYEDEYLAIINKPAGIEVRSNNARNIEKQLGFFITKSKLADALITPRAAHRLDKDTSGCLLVSKTISTSKSLDNLFKAKEIQKSYLAVTQGHLSHLNGSIKKEIDNKEALSIYICLRSIDSERFEKLNLMYLKPKTGRTHQLRIHMQQLGSPIAGDKLYCKKETIKSKGLYLHAYGLSFKHPILNKHIDIKCLPHKKFYKLFPKLEAYIN